MIIWAFYRAFSQLPDWMSDLVIKPLVFAAPIFYYVVAIERLPLSSIGLSGAKFKRDLGIGLSFGLLFAVEGILSNSVKYGRICLTPLVSVGPIGTLAIIITALVASFAEELLIRGFFYTRLRTAYQSELKAMLVSALMYFMLLVPTVFVITRLSGMTLIVFVATNIVMSIANTMIFNETKTLTVPVLIHVFWNLAVVMYL